MSMINLSGSRVIRHSLPRRILHNHSGVVSIALFFIFCCVVFSLITNNFLSSTNWLNIVRQSAPLLIVATAMTLVITTGGIDLSVGSTLALVGALSAIALNYWGLPWPVVLVGGLVLGGLVGAINGFFIAYEGIPAFIVTLAMLAVVRGVALLITQGYSIPIPEDSLFAFMGRAWVIGIPMPALIAIIALAVGHIVLNHMRFGRYVTAIGANAEGARRSGINTKAVTLRVYVISGMAAALAGMIITARLGSGSSNQGEGFELQVIAAVVLGSTSLFGGFGTIIGTLLGAMSIAIIQNGLILSHISPFYTQIATGTIILLAIWLNTRILNPARSPSKG
ncbi:ABC transporter permease [Rahnella inusitata]|jgi:simple sugar transport system permease protein|uniref:ABC transporter permease n=1 Tax=Rahnella inusitata TaxID=58169 RepID=A0ABX9P0U6_9GAMM|nr:ABC transporter permease [Rahnella inusitata]